MDHTIFFSISVGYDSFPFLVLSCSFSPPFPGTKISIRGKGSEKAGKGKKTGVPEDEDALHVLITGETNEQLRRATALIEKLLIPVEEGQNEHKRSQLRFVCLQFKSGRVGREGLRSFVLFCSRVHFAHWTYASNKIISYGKTENWLKSMGRCEKIIGSTKK